MKGRLSYQVSLIPVERKISWPARTKNKACATKPKDNQIFRSIYLRRGRRYKKRRRVCRTRTPTAARKPLAQSFIPGTQLLVSIALDRRITSCKSARHDRRQDLGSREEWKNVMNEDCTYRTRIRFTNNNKIICCRLIGLR